MSKKTSFTSDSFSINGIWKALCTEKLPTFSKGCHFKAGAKEERPFLEFTSLLKLKTEVAELPAIVLDLYSNNNPILSLLFSETPVKISMVEVK